MRLYGAFSKVETQSDGTVRVEGIATSEAVDDQGEIVRAAAIRAAIPHYMRFPALREMHQLSAAGTTLEAEVDDDGVTRIVGHVVDPVAVAKVKNQVYRGFSIGGRVTARDAENKKIITGLQLNEISLVDRPANPEAIFDCWKSEITEGLTDMPGLATIGDTPAGEKLAAAMNTIQIWACDHAGHRHVAKADAIKCFEDDAAANVAGATAEQPAEKPAAAAADTREAPETTEEPAATEKAAGADPGDVETPAPAPGEAATEADASPGSDAAAEVEKRAQDVSDAAQAVIDAATAAMERGEAVLAEPETTEKGAETQAETDGGTSGDETAATAGETAEDDTEAHIRAKVKATIVAAWKAKIDKDGPPSAEKALTVEALVKALSDLASIAAVIEYLDELGERLAYERAVEGDDSTAPEEAEAACAAACSLLRTVANEETAEIMSGSEADMDDEGDQMVIAMTAVAEALRKAGLDNLAEPLEKAGTKRSARDQMLLNAAYTCCAKASGMVGCTKVQKAAFDGAKECIGAAGGKGFDGMAAKSSDALGFRIAIDQLAKGGAHQALADMAHDAIRRVTKSAACTMGKARHSKETMEHLTKAHGFLSAAGASCDVTKDGGEDMVDMAAATAGLAKTDDGRAADLAKALEVAQAEKATLAKTLSEIVPLLDRLSKRVEDIAQTPLPPMVARVGTTSISKTGDGRGDDAREFTTDELAAAIAKLSPNELELIPFKAARFRPLQLNGLRSSSEIRELITR